MMTILKTVSFFMVILGGLKIESFRFEDESEYKNEILLKVFERVLQKKDTPESFILLFFATKVSTVIYTEGG